MSHSILWTLILTLHIVCIAYWVGGTAFQTLITSKTLSLLEAGQRQSVQLQSYTRFLRSLWHVIPTALVTGWLLILHEGGFGAVPMAVNLMQLLALVMAALVARLYFGSFKQARRAIRPQPEVFVSIRRQMTLICLLGILTILCAAFATGV